MAPLDRSRGRSKRLSYGHSVASTGGRAFATRPLGLKYHQPADRKIGIFLPKLQGLWDYPEFGLAAVPRGERVSPRGIAFNCA